jgi:hypothetical protein
MLRGNENTTYSPAWFVEVNGSYFWTWEQAWTHDSLRKVNRGDEDYIYFLEESDRIPLNAGETVYLAGGEFMDKILSLIDSGDIKFSINAWAEISNGYYISAMTAGAFHAFAERLCLDLWEIVEKFLMGGDAELKENAAEAFDAYTAICFYSSDDKKEQSMRRAMFYTRLRDADMLEMEAYVSVRLENFFDTTELFHMTVNERLNELQK